MDFCTIRYAEMGNVRECDVIRENAKVSSCEHFRALDIVAKSAEIN